MKVCKTLFGRIKRPSQSCSRFARLGCEICLTLLDAKNSVRLSDVVPEIFSCSRLDRFFCLLFAAGIYINVNVYLFFGLNPGNGFSLPNSPSSETVPDFLSSLPLSSAGFLSRFLFLLYLPQIQAFLYCQLFRFAVFISFTCGTGRRKRAPPNFVWRFFAHVFCAFGMFYD